MEFESFKNLIAFYKEKMCNVFVTLTCRVVELYFYIVESVRDFQISLFYILVWEFAECLVY